MYVGYLAENALMEGKMCDDNELSIKPIEDIHELSQIRNSLYIRMLPSLNSSFAPLLSSEYAPGETVPDTIRAAAIRLSQSDFASRSFHKCAPVGTENLPLEERLRIYIEVFESGCSNTEMDPESSPEDCPACVRAFVDAVKKAVNYTGVPTIPIPPDVY